MSDSSAPGNEPAESPLDRLRRLAKESTAAKAAARTSEVPPPAGGAAADVASAPSAVPEPAVEEPVAERPVAESTVVDEPEVVEPEVVEPPLAEPAFQEPTFEEPVFEAPAFEAPIFEEPAFDEPAFDEPAFDEPSGEVSAPAVSLSKEPVEEPAEPVAPAEPEVAAEPEVLPEPDSGVAQADPETAAEPVNRPGPPATARRRRRAAEAPAVDSEVAADATPAPPVVPVVLDEGSSGASRGVKVLTGVLAILVALGAVGLVLAILHQRSTADPAKDRAAATAAAIKVVSDTTTLDYRNLDDWLRRVQADSTDGSNPGKGLRSEYASDKDSLASVTATNKSVSVGSVVKSVYCNGYCATSQVAGDTAAALVYGSAKVTSTTTPAGATNLTGFTVKLIKQNGKWLATNVDEVGVSPTS